MIQVHINGLKQIPGIDYTASINSISFSHPPANGDDILVTSQIAGSTGAYMEKLIGNGHTFLYNIDSSFNHRLKLHHLLDEVWKYQDIPAVADVLEQLRVVVELVKENG